MFEYLNDDTLAALALLIFILQYRRVGTFFNLLKTKLRPSSWRPLPRADLPAHTRDLLDCAALGMKDTGFELVDTQWAVPIYHIDPRPRIYSDVYWHPEQSVLARVELGEALTGQDTKIEFQSLFADGTVLRTINRERWATLPDMDGHLLEDVYADDRAVQWRAHREAVAREAGRGVVSDRAEIEQRADDLSFTRRLEHLCRIGWTREEGPGQYGFTLRGAWRYSGRMLSRLRQARALLALPYRHDPEPDATTARLAEMDMLAASLALAAQPPAAWLKIVLFVASLALAVLLFGWSAGPVQGAAIITVLLVHELGHLAAMRLFDYRNLSILFLPFGAVAMGHKPHASPWQEAVVLLAGPVPGLLLAFAAFQLPSDALPDGSLGFVRAFAWTSLILNLVNLLPVGMLDGGRLFELALLGRFPHARAVFATLGAAAFGAYALSTGSAVMAVATGLIAFTLPWQFRSARVIASIRTRSGREALEGEQALHAMALEFARRDYGGGSVGYSRRLAVARMAYPRLLQGVPSVGASLGITASLAAAWLVPLAAMIWAGQQPERQPLLRQTAAEQARSVACEATQQQPQARQAAEALMARYAAEADPEAKWVMLDRYEEEAEWPFDGFPDGWLEQQRAVLAGQLPADHPGVLMDRLLRTTPNTPEAVSVPSAIIALLGGDQAPGLDSTRFFVLREAYRQLAAEAPLDRLEEAKSSLDTLWSATSAAPALADERPDLAYIRARMAVATGQIDDAAAWMERYRSEADPEDGWAALLHAWFLLDADRPAAALSAATDALRGSDLLDYQRQQWQTLAGWTEMALGRPREADAYFQAVLHSRHSRLSGGREGVPWWRRWLDRLSIALWARHQINAPMLDHLAALEGYDPPAAANLKAELKEVLARRGNRPLHISYRVNDWGNAREAAGKRLLRELGAETGE